MAKKFNVYGACRPAKHYMVDLASRLEKIKNMVDDGDYFTINRARQYGKTTIMRMLAHYLEPDYITISLDFQRMGSFSFESEPAFVAAFAGELLYFVREIPNDVKKKLGLFADETNKRNSLQQLFQTLSLWCRQSEKPIVLMIDEVDTAANNQVFLDFLAQLRAYYLDSDVTPTFQSVILAGVYDVRNMKRKIRSDSEHKTNSPWNIAAKFQIDMHFESDEIAGMLEQYESDYQTGMDIGVISGMIYDYTSGYPYLVSLLCKIMDEEIAGSKGFPDKRCVWTEKGIAEAVQRLLLEKNTLFESLIGKINDYPEMKNMISRLLFRGQSIAYNADDPVTDLLLMFGFVKEKSGTVQIANRIFETRLYNYFLTLPEAQGGEMYQMAFRNRNQFIRDGYLDMELILRKFTEHFDDVYGDREQKFIEDDGRRYFMLYLKPIINGTGNYYVETQTRNQERTDLIIDYRGIQYILEMKIWHGNAYNERGEKQLADYLEYYHLKKGYMLSFNFNKNKKIGVEKIVIGDKLLIEAVV
ncbi:MAG: ATP-binding protein [Clostridiales bacterium]|nr:ATP-binding protein [Clostridiales bacterium]